MEYKNKDQNITNYWVGVKEIRISNKMLFVDGLQLGKYALKELTIHIPVWISFAGAQ